MATILEGRNTGGTPSDKTRYFDSIIGQYSTIMSYEYVRHKLADAIVGFSVLMSTHYSSRAAEKVDDCCDRSAVVSGNNSHYSR